MRCCGNVAGMGTRRRLTEDIVRGGSPTVDRAAGVVRGVKVLGLVSSNGRRYLPEAVKKAIPLYEGASVRCNHPRKATDPRAVDDVLGQLRNVRQDAAGDLWGDLHLLTSHPMAARLMESAEKMPGVWGLSHNAEGDTERVNGVEIVREILEVRSVDLVTDPATTRGLAEERRVTVKLRAFLESALPKLAAGPKRQRLKKLLREWGAAGGCKEKDMVEAGMDDPGATAMMAPEDTGEGGDGGDPETALWQGFRAAAVAIIDGDGSAEEKAKKIRAYLKSHEKLAGGEGGGEPVEEEEDEDVPAKPKKDDPGASGGGDDNGGEKVKESVELRLLRREKKARILCEQQGVAADADLLEALAQLDEPAMKKMVAREKAKGLGRRPRTQIAEAHQGDADDLMGIDAVADGKTFAEQLRRGAFR